MAERFSEIEKAAIGNRSLEERLIPYPELKTKVETMLSIIENAGGNVEKAAEAERRIIEETEGAQRQGGCEPEGCCCRKRERFWMEEKKNWLKENRWQDVLKTLEPFLEDSDVADKDAPVRACQRYIANRSNYLDYKAALADGLPIGSGEIESAHRYVFQVRLKIAGAWWKMENLGKMVALRVLRANRRWDHYWSATDRKVA